jgi:hypothetical protein
MSSLLLPLSFRAQAGFLSCSWAGESRESTGLVQKNDGVLAGATEADRGSDGSYSRVSKEP